MSNPNEKKSLPFHSRSPHPLRKLQKTYVGDRYIPCRRSSDYEGALFKLYSPKLQKNDSNRTASFSVSNASNYECKPGSPMYNKRIARLSCGRSEERVLSFSPKRRNSTISNLKKLYQDTEVFSPPRSPTTRPIPTSPEKMLDMPDFCNDFYTETLDWSSKNCIAVGVKSKVCTWNVDTGDVKIFYIKSKDQGTNITAVAWDTEGKLVAMGTDGNEIEVWNPVERCSDYQFMSTHKCNEPKNTTSIEWLPNENNTLQFFCGQLCGCVHRVTLDSQDKINQVDTLLKVSGGVAKLTLSKYNNLLAIGSGNGYLIIWNLSKAKKDLKLKVHKAAVKALSWCPWNHKIIATGGGSGDGLIRCWNLTTGTIIAEVDTKSQVCDILWSKEYMELVSAHGGQSNALNLWKFSKLQPLGSLCGHSQRVLHLACSPDGTKLASIGADESLFIWHCFPKVVKRKPSVSSPLARVIR